MTTDTDTIVIPDGLTAEPRPREWDVTLNGIVIGWVRQDAFGSCSGHLDHRRQIVEGVSGQAAMLAVHKAWEENR